MKKKAAIIGGTFDPIHIGHLIIGQSARITLGVDKVYFMPAGIPPHKPDRKGGASALDRLNMVKLALEDNPGFDIITYEIEKKSSSYLFETLEYLTENNPDTEYYFIMGGDSLRDFHKWKHPEIISGMCTIAAACRDEISGSSFEECSLKLSGMYGTKTVRIEAPLIGISSSEIRKMVKEGKSVRYLVPEKVLNYIHEHNLYMY
ncbi:MAG: nicotinate-nucleotide adenylyltransferase [Lachnospiraceae bacterium]|jgi:nicotinate-nucleotide adenylyltransferase